MHNDLNKQALTAILFDLDGTLFDTAPDLAFALDQLCINHHQPRIPFDIVRPLAGRGSNSLLKLAFDIDVQHPQYATLYEEFIHLYEVNIIKSTQLFFGMEKVIAFLVKHHIPWGVVTNKSTQLTQALLKALPLPAAPDCIVCGDSLARRKPFPDPILHACKLLRQDPETCIYLGDTEIDVIASKAAGTCSLVALYGYVAHDDKPENWLADGYINHPTEVLNWLKTSALLELS